MKGNTEYPIKITFGNGKYKWISGNPKLNPINSGIFIFHEYTKMSFLSTIKVYPLLDKWETNNSLICSTSKGEVASMINLMFLHIQRQGSNPDNWLRVNESLSLNHTLTYISHTKNTWIFNMILNSSQQFATDVSL